MDWDRIRLQISEMMDRHFAAEERQRRAIRRFQQYAERVVEKCLRADCSRKFIDHHLAQLLSVSDKRDIAAALAPLEWFAHAISRGVEGHFGGDGEPDLYLQSDGREIPVEVYAPRGEWHQSDKWHADVVAAFRRKVRPVRAYGVFPDERVLGKLQPQQIGSTLAKYVNLTNPGDGQFVKVYCEHSANAVSLRNAVVVNTSERDVNLGDEEYGSVVKSVWSYSTGREFNLSVEVACSYNKDARGWSVDVRGLSSSDGAHLRSRFGSYYEKKFGQKLDGWRCAIRVTNAAGLEGTLLSEALVETLERSRYFRPFTGQHYLMYCTTQTSPAAEVDGIVMVLGRPYYVGGSVDFNRFCILLLHNGCDLVPVAEIETLLVHPDTSDLKVVAYDGGGGTCDGTRLTKALESKRHQLPPKPGGLFAVTSYEMNVDGFDIRKFIRIDATRKAAGLFAQSTRVHGVLLGFRSSASERSFDVWGYAPNPHSRDANCDAIATALGARRWFEWEKDGSQWQFTEKERK